MTKLEQANSKKLSEFLAKYGYRPAFSSASKDKYYSPFHAESTPSFYIRHSDGKWKDYSVDPTGMFKSNVDFVEQYCNVSKSEAIRILLNEDLKLTKFEAKEPDNTPYYEIVNKGPLTGRRIEYLLSRKINPDLAQDYCTELSVRYPKSKNPTRAYKLIGFENMSKGFEVRMKYPYMDVKSTLTPNNITKIEGSDEELIFEGFFNFLSYITLFGVTEKTVYVLNGIGNWKFIKSLNNAEYWGDNGYHWNEKWVYPGDDLLHNLRQLGPVFDARYKYAGWEDLNDFLVFPWKFL